jgi:hypothetical protein
MTRVFIGGSRRVSRLNDSVRERLDRIIKGGFPIVIGDANGADKAVQRYLFENGYSNVEVFCSDDTCRNNIGKWTIREIATASRKGTPQFYSAKDRAMAQEATIGLMVWDGTSIGTVMNVFRLINLGKKAVLYSLPERRFLEFKDLVYWDEFVANSRSDFRNRVLDRMKLENPDRTARTQASLFG